VRIVFKMIYPKSYTRIVSSSKRKAQEEVLKLVNKEGLDDAEKYYVYVLENSFFKNKTLKNMALYRLECIKILRGLKC